MINNKKTRIQLKHLSQAYIRGMTDSHVDGRNMHLSANITKIYILRKYIASAGYYSKAFLSL